MKLPLFQGLITVTTAWGYNCQLPYSKMLTIPTVMDQGDDHPMKDLLSTGFSSDIGTIQSRKDIRC